MLIVVIGLLAGGCGSSDHAAPTNAVAPAPVENSSATNPGKARSSANPPGAAAAVPPAAPYIDPVAVAPTASDFPAARWADPSLTLRVPILMYHVVGPGLDAPRELADLVVPTATFEAQMTTLRTTGWHTVTMAQLAYDLATGVRPPPRTFVVTVDDGHVDGLTIITPILRALGFAATFYIVPGRLGHDGYLNADQVRALIADGMDVGNHTVHHLDLASLGQSRLYAEIGGAEAILADMTGVDPVTLAYPSGEENPTVVAVAQAVGLALAVTTQYGALETWANRLTLPRVRVHGASSATGLMAALASLGG